MTPKSDIKTIRGQYAIKHVTRKLIIAASLILLMMGDATAVDSRSYQHGIKFLSDANENHWLIWSSSPGNPPEGHKKIIKDDGSKCSYFTHDIFTAPLNVDKPSIQAQILVELPEAQEPVDAAIAQNGSIAITYEDGSESNIEDCHGVIKQRYKVYSQFPHDSTTIKTVTIEGAHSGHITAVGNNFVIVYAEGWIEGGGVGDAGTANDIYVDVIGSKGQIIHHKAIAVDQGQPRDWWPLIAGSPRHAMLVWQRLSDASNSAQLVYTLYDPLTNRIVKPASVLKNKLQHYHYDVQYLPAIKRFLIIGNYLGSIVAKEKITIITPKLFAYLLDETGRVIDYWENDTACYDCGSQIGINLVREARPAIISDKKSVSLLYPAKSNIVVRLDINEQRISFNGVNRVKQYWFSMGSDGLYLNNNNVLFANLTPSGVKIFKFSVSQDNW